MVLPGHELFAKNVFTSHLPKSFPDLTLRAGLGILFMRFEGIPL